MISIIFEDTLTDITQQGIAPDLGAKSDIYDCLVFVANIDFQLNLN